MNQRKILIVDDEVKVSRLIQAYLEKSEYETALAAHGKTALELAQQYKPDLILLDLNLPGIDGLEVCKALRASSNIPIIMLTARDDEVDKVVGLELGADDYITKPFSPREVVARVNAVLRRYKEGEKQTEEIVAGDLSLDLARHEATYLGQVLQLTNAEFKLLSVLAGHPGRVYTRLQLMDLAFGQSYEGYDRTIDAHMKNLRQKMARLASEERSPLVTVRGVGYKLEAQ